MDFRLYTKVLFFSVAIVFTFFNIKERFFSEKVRSFSLSYKTDNVITVYFLKTTVTYLSRKLSEIDFPMFLTFFARPGYNISRLRRFGFNSELALFMGKNRLRNGTIHIYWGNDTDSIQGEQERRMFIIVCNVCPLFGGPSSLCRHKSH